MTRLLFFAAATFWGGTLQAQQTVGLFIQDSLSWNGYTLLAPSSSTETFLIDPCGREVQHWSSPYTPGLVARLLPDGSLFRTGRIPSTVFTGGGLGGVLQRFDWDGNPVWSYDYSGSAHHQHHDALVMPNGHVLMLAWEYWSSADALAAGRDPALLDDALWAEQILELEPIGEDSATIVWRWNIKDHLVQNLDPLKPDYGDPAAHPGRVDLNFIGAAPASEAAADWTHANSIAYHPGRDEIMLSVRNFHELWVIDHSTSSAEAASSSGGNSGKGGDLLYRWGNPAAHGSGTAAARQFFSQHDAHWIADSLADGGKIMVFNNGVSRSEEQASSVEILTPPLDGSGHYVMESGLACGPASAERVYPQSLTPDFFSPNVSGAQRLPNGHTLICEGAKGRLLEVDPAGDIHWEYINPVGLGGPVAQGNPPFSNGVFRTYRYSPGYSGLAGRDLTPGAALELNPLPEDCALNTGTGPDAVFGQGTSNQIRVFPNPFSDRIWLHNPTGEYLRVTIFDVFGRILVSADGPGQWMSWPTEFRSGMLWVRVEYLNGHAQTWKLGRD